MNRFVLLSLSSCWLVLAAACHSEVPCLTKGAVKKDGVCHCPDGQHSETLADNSLSCLDDDAGSLAGDGGVTSDAKVTDARSPSSLDATATDDAQASSNRESSDAAQMATSSDDASATMQAEQDASGTMQVVHDASSAIHSGDDAGGPITPPPPPPPPACVPTAEVCDQMDNNCNGQVDEGNACPAPAPTVSTIANGAYHTCAGLSNGTVKCWGGNDSGQLGVSISVYQDAALVPGISTAVELAAGLGHTCARLSDGTVSCWGLNADGQLGDGTINNTSSPSKVPGISGVKQLAASWSQTCVVLSDNTVSCWGKGGTVATTPTQVPLLTGAIKVTVGMSHNCALKATGDILCWGSNYAGELGTGSSGDYGVMYNAAVRASLGSVTATGVATGLFHSCALLPPGTVSCWGSNGQSELGVSNSNADHSLTPVAVPGLSGVTQLAAGGEATCALLSSGDVECWGTLVPDRLSGTSTTGSPTPHIWATGATKVYAGDGSACAVLNTGKVVCWGQNTQGQLGGGQIGMTAQAVTVLGLP